MTLSPRRAVLGLLFGLAASAHASPAPDPDLARNLAATCTGCHGTDGHARPDATMPVLAGVPAPELMQKLREFRSGTWPATIMPQIAKGYSEAQLELIAAYFAARK